MAHAIANDVTKPIDKLEVVPDWSCKVSLAAFESSLTRHRPVQS